MCRKSVVVLHGELVHSLVVMAPDNQVQRRLSSPKFKERHSGRLSARSISHDYMDPKRRKPRFSLLGQIPHPFQPRSLYHKQLSRRTSEKAEIGRVPVVYLQAVPLHKFINLNAISYLFFNVPTLMSLVLFIFFSSISWCGFFFSFFPFSFLFGVIFATT